MRPLGLKVQGFTAFRDEVDLDLTRFDLFAICGPTGSGKSSLLDAMTYALFGLVERVGKQVSQLISQGQARMRVQLDFQIGDDVYRIARSTPVTGATKVVMQRRDGDEWVTAGDECDRVTGVNKKVQSLLGLDYDAFTRSVLLPQGKFAEFLVGEASKRRELLVELLGLELFKRMAARANEIARGSGAEAETTARLIEETFAGVTPEALTAARASIEAAAGREETLTKAAERVGEISERWSSTRMVVAALTACARDAREVGTVVRRSAETIAARAAEIAKLHDAGGEDLAALVEVRAKAAALRELRTEAAAAAKSLAEALAREPVLAKAATAKAAALAKAQEALTKADIDLLAVRDAYSALAKKEALAVACEGLHAGDECPVCGGTLTIAPPKPTRALAKVEAEGKKLGETRAALESALRGAQRAHDQSERDTADARKECARLEGEGDKRAKALTASEQTVAKAFGSTVPDDAVEVLGERIAAARALTEARAAIDTERTRLESQPLASLGARARDAGGESVPVLTDVSWSSTPPDGLSTAATSLAGELDALATALDGVAARHGTGEVGLLQEAREVVGELLPLARTFEELLAALSEGMRAATGAVARARAEVETLTERLAQRTAYAAKVAELGARADTFKVLARELQANNLIAYLQTEALQVLCAAGTAHLRDLSDGRYRLECEDDEFLVVDTWNGEERRSVKTLSGGETFMASLALALALSEQVQSLAVGRRARLDSLFLDEGFGTLDPESLEEVAQTIARLGDGGRMVGIITHIAELADSLPAKITVEKSPRGSRVHVSV